MPMIENELTALAQEVAAEPMRYLLANGEAVTAHRGCWCPEVLEVTHADVGPGDDCDICRRAFVAALPASPPERIAIFWQIEAGVPAHEPFISEIYGAFTVDVLKEIEADLEEDAERLFDQGSGTYWFTVSHNEAQTGEYGRIEVPAHHELSVVDFEPLQDE